MHLILLMALSATCWSAILPDDEIKRDWIKFKQKYGKSSRTIEATSKSFDNFKQNIRRIAEHNKLYQQSLVSYRMGVNAFANMNLKEMETFYMGLKINEMEKERFLKLPQFLSRATKIYPLPTSVDWRNKGAITPVKNQLGCGSCWAFSTTGALEAHHFLQRNKSVLLSEQNLIDCVKDNFGCQGGWMIPCFDYIRLNGGINSESKYPYEGLDAQCRFQSKYIAATCNGYNRIRQNDEQQLLEAVALKGPVAAAIAVNSNFLNYVEGVYDDFECTYSVNHAVLVVGYGTENGQDYWLVKNSWGVEWGDKGYIKMARNKNNQCGIASYASYPLI